MKYILTFDQSTFSTKAFIIDTQGNVITSVSYKHKQYYLKNGWVEHDATEIYDNLIKAVTTIKEKEPNLISNVVGISITNQRETTVLWDTVTDKPLANAIVWQCRRTAPMCEELKPYEDVVENATGLKINPYFSATKLKWLLDSCPQDDNHTYFFGTMDSWLLYKLTNGEKHVTDVTNASRTLLMNIETLSWDDELCDIFGIPKYVLPTILKNDDIFGYTDIDGLLEHKIPISGVIGDSQAALYAQHCYKEGMMKATLGTGTSILINAGNKKPKTTKGIVSAIGWSVEDQVTYAMEAIINCSGDTLNWLRDQLHLFNDDSELNTIWDTVKHNDGVYLVPAFVGLSVPWWNSEARASICGLSRNHNYEYILRAGLESIAFQIYDAAVALGYSLDQSLNVDGGAVENTGLLQFIADILQIEVIVSDNHDLSAMGSYEIARTKLLGKTNLSRKKKIYKHKMPDGMRNNNIKGWHQAVNGVLTISRKEDGV